MNVLTESAIKAAIDSKDAQALSDALDVLRRIEELEAEERLRTITVQKEASEKIEQIAKVLDAKLEKLEGDVGKIMLAANLRPGFR
jgi:flagellar motility protein MotE (MotC chaperone)